ncbi:DUF1329 domain-containing protein [Panacagrimonas sp.]|uniref:DUF1329 domain-containing protein n=1 Tax=Panacagrimonas sp. TaxID=2480088 RepID=UPI003B5176FC
MRDSATPSTNRHTRRRLAVAALVAVAPALTWSAAQADASKLGGELTPIGAIRAANADGSIPEFTGEKNFPEDMKTWTPEHLESLRTQDAKKLEAEFQKAIKPELLKPFDTVTKANMAKYADKLTDGHKALLEKYPTYKMPLFKGVRTGFFPKEIEEATIKNASTAKLTGTDLVTGASIGFPFPIPKSGAEVIWNHRMKYRGNAVTRYNNQAIVKPDGSYQITKLTEEVKFKYANFKDPAAADNKYLLMYLSETISPPRVAGQLTLAHELIGPDAGSGRAAWIFSPGLGRVNRAPDVGYDNPAVGTDNEQYFDQIDVFNGSLDRYDWKLIGRKEMYIPYNSYQMNSPLVKYKDMLKPFHVNQDNARYELHRVWVVEANVKQGVRHNFAKRVFYVDEDSWSIAAVDCYDGRGELWKVQEAHLITAPFVPTVTGSPEIIYDLQSTRYFVTAMANEDKISDFHASFDDKEFEPSALKRKSRTK